MINKINQYVQAKQNHDDAKSSMAALFGQLMEERNRVYLSARNEAESHPLYKLLASREFYSLYSTEKAVERTYIDWHFDEKGDWTFTRHDSEIEATAAPLVDAIKNLMQQVAKTKADLFKQISAKYSATADRLYLEYQNKKAEVADLAACLDAQDAILRNDLRRIRAYQEKRQAIVSAVKAVMDVNSNWTENIDFFVEDGVPYAAVSLEMIANFSIDTEREYHCRMQDIIDMIRFDAKEQIATICENLGKIVDNRHGPCYNLGMTDVDEGPLVADVDDFDDTVYYSGIANGRQIFSINFVVRVVEE